MKKRRWIAFLLFFFCLSVAYAQDQGYLEVKGTIKVDRENLENAKINIYLNGNKEKVYTTNDRGKFEFNIDLNKEYDIVVSKQGYYSKILYINSKIPTADVGIWKYAFAMELIPEIEGFDASLLDEPIGKIRFYEKFGDFDYDEEYTLSIQKRYREMLRAYEKARREAYKKTVAKADDAFNNKDYDTAIELYNKAIDIDPYELYPDDQLYAIGKIIAEDEKNEEKYEENIAKADEYFNNKEYGDAQKYYERALNYKNEKYPKNQLASIKSILEGEEDALEEQRAKERAYNEAIAAGDRSFDIREYENALQKFKDASSIKPSEQYPKEKITELNRIIAELNKNKQNQAEIDKAYLEAIALADNKYEQKALNEALSNYKKASTIKPGETYPRTRINEINNLLAANQSMEQKYAGFVAAADEALSEKKYQEAKGNYQQALTIKPSESYPKQKIVEIDALLAQLEKQKLKDKEQAYLQLLAQADAQFNKNEYLTAKEFYNQALTINSQESYPKQRIAEIDNILEKQANKKRAYDLAIARADNQFNAENWEGAKVDYVAALEIFPDEQYPQSRLNEIENKLLSAKNAKEQRIAREKAYKAAISKGDSLLNLKNYLASKNAYNSALAIKADEVYPRTKINEIDGILAQQKAMDERYNGLVASADQLFINDQYERAKGDYLRASKLKPEEQHPKKRIAEIDQLLAKAKAEKEEREKIQAQYDELITQADNNFNTKEWQQAKMVYTQASVLKPNETYPKQRIVEIDNMLAKAAEKEEQYANAIESADALFANKSYGEAMAFYSSAIDIKPNESYPQQQLVKINDILAKQKEQEAAYENFIMLADAAFSSNELEKAKSQYQSALSIKPNKEHPRQRLAEIERQLEEKRKNLAEKERLEAQYKSLIAAADQYFNQKQYNQAKEAYQSASFIKPDEMYPKNKLDEIDQLLEAMANKQAAYENKINEGAALLNQQNYQGALSAYQAAAQIKPNEQLPREKINEIQTLLAANKKKQAQYDQFIASADKLFNQKSYSEAKPLYQQARSLMPNQNYPQEQLNKIEGFLAEKAKRDAEQKALMARYNQKIKEADAYFEAKNYIEALPAYMDAKGIKPDENYPDQQMARINQLIKQEQDKLEADFNNAIKMGDRHLSNKDWEKARQQYNLAQNLKPNDPLPPSKITELNNLIESEKQAAKQQAKIDADYNNYIDQADKAFNNNDYTSAMALYKNARNIKPAESYPKERIQLCEAKIQQQKALASAKEEERRQKELEDAQDSYGGDDFDYKGEERDRKFLNELAKKYPEGITVENYNKPNKKIKRVIVNYGGIAKEYIEVKYSYGTFYFRNGQNISRSIFYSETKE